MDSPSSQLDGNIDLSKLSDRDKQELQQFLVNETQKARIQQSMLHFCLSGFGVLDGLEEGIARTGLEWMG
jgi:hypothetical protein